MKYSKHRRNISINRRMFLGLAIAVILFGASFFSINIIKYAKGYFAIHVNTETVDPSVTESKGSILSISNDMLTDEEKVLYPERPEIGDKIGELYIPKLDATLPIYHGTSDDELDKGVGHYADSVLPGENDNSVLSGHRDTVFRKLGEVGEGDSLIVRTSAGEFEYIVNKVRIVEKDDRTVIVPKPRATLTISTCYPFKYIGSAPERYVLVAYLASETLNK